ncbi:unnamed protein product [Pylaiella littoralis]
MYRMRSVGGMTAVAAHARKSALALCLYVCGSLTYTSSAFLNPNLNAALTRAPADVSTTHAHRRRQQQQACFRSGAEARHAPRRRPHSCVAGGLRLSAVGGGGGEGEEEGTSEIFVATETLLDDPSHMERIMAAIAKLVPAVEPLDGVFKTAVSHHCALRTSNIARAMKFYSLLGMTEVVRFKAENARCAFLEGAGMRLELIEVPASMEPENKAADLAADMRSTGLNHIAFDIGPAIEAEGLNGMKGFLSELNRQSEAAFGMSVRLVVSPYEQRIGQDIFDLAFIMDADGVLLELVHKKDTLDVDMPKAW